MPESFYNNFEKEKENFSVAEKELGRFEVSCPYVDLSSDGEPLKFAVTIEKSPTLIQEGTKVGTTEIDLENQSEKLKFLVKQAEELKKLPEVERPRKLMEILRSKVDYAYNSVIEELQKTNPELAEWVQKNVGLGSGFKPVKLSEVVEYGYGVCGHLATILLALGKKAGLEGAYLTSRVGSDKETAPIINVLREDNKEPLFRCCEVGEPVNMAHAWVEFLTKDGEWIPVDPSTKLVGDTDDGLKTFQKAGYKADTSFSLWIHGFPADVGYQNLLDFEFSLGESTHTAELAINSQPRQRPIIIKPKGQDFEEDKEDGKKWPKPTQYTGPLNFIVTSVHNDEFGVSVKVNKVEKI